ncbi:MAG: class I SAM-dependent methyltransferase [Rubrivivax sp.]|nr:class I SAM-dependent methyltransferase [Rubrivivax sp.]
MHLHDLLENGNRRVSISGGVAAARMTIDGNLVMGAELDAGGLRRIVVRGASDLCEFSGSDDAGFGALLESRDVNASREVTVAFESAHGRAARTTTARSGFYTRLQLPSMLDLPDPFAPADLVIECDPGPDALFIGTSGRTPRDALYRLAKGFGVEIGPGPRPQIHSKGGTRVLYVEEKSAEQWATLYRPDAGADAWTQPGYIIGQAHALPVEDGTLDFIFSSHVLEHLYNPLGHFDHWRRKLKPGGLVLGVVPAADGTKDFIRPPTSLLDLLAEHRAGGFAVPISSYEKWVRELQPHHPDPAGQARRQFEEKISIHVHVYDHVTITNMLRHCVQAHGYAAHRLLYRRNAKDFAFVLKADGARKGAT